MRQRAEDLQGRRDVVLCYARTVSFPSLRLRLGGALVAGLVAATAVGACASSRRKPLASPPPVSSAERSTPDVDGLEGRCADGDFLACPKVCLAGKASACTLLGRAGIDTPGAIPSETARWLRRGCELSDAQACYLLAEVANMVPAIGVPADERELLMTQACEANHAPACLSLGLVLESAGAPRRAAIWFERGCRHGAARACFNLAVMHHQGAGVPLDLERAIALYEEACNAGEPVACSDLAVMIREGQGTAIDDVRAVSLFESACRSGVQAACHNLGLHAEEGRGLGRNLARAAAMYEGACERGIAAACVNLAAMFEAGDGVQRDRKRAEALFRKACDAGLQQACEHLSIVGGR